MKPTTEVVTKDLVLVGGGHAHAIALRMLGMNPIPGVRITLLTKASDTPYSGMLPGHIAGLYSHEDCHIDLRSLADFAQAQFYLDRVIGLDLESQRVLCANRPPVAFDLLSLDIGSTPTVPETIKAAASNIPVKPIRRFLQDWHQIVDRVRQEPHQFLSLGIVGGGAGGVELALAVQRHLHEILRQAQQPSTNLEMHLFQRGEVLLPGQSRWVSDRLQHILQQRGVHLHLSEAVVDAPEGWVKCKSGLAVACDYTFWVTQAAAPDWLRAAGLATDERGFVWVDDTLRSLSHANVFAAGDIATMKPHPRPKAGVFAVRQGKPLYENLRRALLGQPLRPYKPQKFYLSLIGTSELSTPETPNTAIAAWGPFGWQSQWLWKLKDAIDRRFMERFSPLPQMSKFTRRRSPLASLKNTRLFSLIEGKAGLQVHSLHGPLNPPSLGEFEQVPPRLGGLGGLSREREQLAGAQVQPQNLMRCAGCGAKIGGSILERTLQRLQQDFPHLSDRSDILIGLDAPDDAAVIQVPSDRVLVQTIDYFRALINDPYVFGQISANHCLSDIFAMGATPQSALAIATIPYALDAKVEETLYQLLSGAAKVLQEAGAALIGGHTTEGAELALGLTCNGLAARDRLLRKSGMQPDQVLILTKPIGTGTLFAAAMQQQAKGIWIDQAVGSMLISNQAAATCLWQHKASACTDVTGFGLLGHLLEMVTASQVAVELELAAIPVLAGAQITVERGIFSSLHPQNIRTARQVQNWSAVSDRPEALLLCDPQTSGGLLAAIPVEQVSDCLRSLQTLGYLQSSVIGRVLPRTAETQPIRIVI